MWNRLKISEQLAIDDYWFDILFCLAVKEVNTFAIC